MVEWLQMKVLILYRPKSESATALEAFVRDFKQGHEAAGVQVVDADSSAGIAAAELYSIVNYPAILALREDGSVAQSWEGEPLPLMDDVAYYTYSQA